MLKAGSSVGLVVALRVEGTVDFGLRLPAAGTKVSTCCRQRALVRRRSALRQADRSVPLAARSARIAAIHLAQVRLIAEGIAQSSCRMSVDNEWASCDMFAGSYFSGHEVHQDLDAEIGSAADAGNQRERL